MAGKLVPLVLIPRYSCFSGASVFTTLAIDASAYSKVYLTAWRSAMLGSASPTIGITVQEASDQTNEASWTTVSGFPTPWSLATPDVEESDEGTFTKRWLRLRLELTGTGPSVTCWVIGFLEMRE